jgi:hypothetical protein
LSYAPGSTTEQLGAHYAWMLDAPTRLRERSIDFVIGLDDANKYDMHCNADFQHANLRVYEKMRAPADVVDALRMQACPTLAGIFGTQVSVTDGMTSTGVTTTTMGGTIGSNYVNAWASNDPDFTQLAYGDDTIYVARRESVGAEFQDRRLSLGLRYKQKQVPLDQAYRGEFCQYRPWPTSARRIVWGPKPGRLIAKLGWTPDKLRTAKARIRLRGIALGYAQTVAHVPFLRYFIPKLLSLTEGVDTAPSRADWDLRANKSHQPCEHDFVLGGVDYPSTHNMLYALYGLTADDEGSFVAALNAVTTLPSLFSHYTLDRLAQVDVFDA